ncbi:lactonase family protein [Dysgonomonas sp. 25]|uniref:lactonase family protein n=1 Tax=Dysgonomonas sp. 25 TaxID=2302933 RepID=UPI0013D48035|nr:lactonase family protein [Dysgonomonas sp. 25]NDV67640.1 lactonase family protein [Dysgonomonas sp. 25]
MMKHLIYIVILLLACSACHNSRKQDITDISMEKFEEANSLYLLVGTYTTGESNGIYVYKFDTLSGFSQYISTVEVENPSYLVAAPDEKHIYSVTENDTEAAYANAFAFDKKDGKLTFLNKQQTGGLAPCYITIDKEQKFVVTADYLGTLTVFPTDATGRLEKASQVFKFEGKGIDRERQNQPHIHTAEFSPDGDYLFATDLGTDKIYKFDVNATESSLKKGTPESFAVKGGVGPRHLAFHPNGKYAYLITEMGGTVIGFNYKDGMLEEFQTIVADTLHAKGSADIHISPDGRFLYASNRLQGDGIAIFSIDQSNGQLTKVAYQPTGIHPRNFVITPNGKYLLVACRDSDLIQIYSINKATGLLEDTSKTIELDMPVCLKFVSTE